MESKRRVCVFIVGFIVLLATPSVSYGDRFERSVPSKDISIVQIKTFHQTNIKVMSWDKKEIKVESSAGNLDVDVENGAVQIRNKVMGENVHEVMVGGDMTVKMPKSIKLQIKTVTGNVAVKGLENSARVSAVNGNVRVEDCRKVVSIKTVDGSVTARRISGELTVKAVSGDIIMNQVSAGRLEATTVSGDIKVKGVKANHIELTTHSGNVEYEGGLSSSGDLAAKSFSGNVKISLPDSVGFELSAKTQNGRVKIEHPIQASEQSSGSVTGRFKKGGGDVTLATFSGNIKMTIAKSKN